MHAWALRAGIGLLAGAILAAVLTGGGSLASSAPPRSPAATVAQMKAAVNAANSVHLDGVLHNSGRAVALDVGLLRSGGFAGTIVGNGVPLTLIDTGGKVYIKATPAFMREMKVSSAVCSVICGKYVELTSAQTRALAGNFTMRNLLASLTGTLPEFADAGTTTVNGRQARVLRASDGSMLDVAATGTPYPLRAIGKAHSGWLDFTQWNSVPQPAAPPASQVINMSSLGGLRPA
jgi:hypothetical protein